MKRTFTTILALTIALVAVAQSSTSIHKPSANAVLVSQTRNGNTITTRYLVPHKNDTHAEFDVHYVINRSDIASAYGKNSGQMDDLKQFMQRTVDTMMHIGAIAVHGYASPDGNAQQNDTLAARRAASLYHYAVNTYHPKVKITTSSHTFSWKECVPAVTQSDIPNKEQVLAILNSQNSEPQKEQMLRKYPTAWKYLTSQILPKMRYADIGFDYGVDELVTTTYTAPAAQPAAQPTSTQQPAVVIVDEETGIIVATPKDGDCDRKCRKEQRKQQRSEHQSTRNK